MFCTAPPREGQRVEELKAWNPESFSWYHPDDPICVQSGLISASILKIFCTFIWLDVLGLTNLDIGFVYWCLLIRSGPAWVFPIRTDCITVILNVEAKGGTIRWNWHITPDLYFGQMM
jgi:hypothetical protein